MLYFKLGNVFHAPRSFSLAHCISQDTSVGLFKGISVQFLRMYPQLHSLRSETVTLGSAEPVKVDKIFIYNLISKPTYWSKPKLKIFEETLMSMFNHACSNGVTDIAAPRLGSGLDKLDFDHNVYPLILKYFGSTRVNLHVFSLNVVDHISTIIRYF